MTKDRNLWIGVGEAQNMCRGARGTQRLPSDRFSSEQDQVVSREPPDVHHRSPDFRELQCKARNLKKAI